MHQHWCLARDQKEMLTSNPMGVAYQPHAKPFINPKHIDGPMLCMRTGEVHWLTLWERIQLRFGWTDPVRLERKRTSFAP